MSDIDETPVSPAFQKGFNNGYLLQKHEPTIIEDVLKEIAPTDLPYVYGLKSGSAEFKKEQFHERLSSNANEKGNDKSIEGDLGIEHEKT